jgi:hypothetical protein
MHHVARTLEQQVIWRKTTDIPPLQHNIRVQTVMLEVFFPSPDHVVDDSDRETTAHQQIDHVTANETGAAGDDRNRFAAHRNSLFMKASYLMRTDGFHGADVVILVIVKAGWDSAFAECSTETSDCVFD